MIRPTAATVAGLDPEMAPKNSHVPTVVSARLPRTPPNIERTQRISRSEIPPWPMTSPAKMKKGTARSANLSMLPNMVWGTTVKGTFMKKARSTITVTRRIKKIGSPRASSAKGTSAIAQPIIQRRGERPPLLPDTPHRSPPGPISSRTLILPADEGAEAEEQCEHDQAE